MSRADRRAEKAAAKAAKAEAKLGERIEDAYDDSDRTLSHNEACRDSVYALPTSFAHIRICFMTQMKRFTKQRTVWLMAILLIAMPVLFIYLNNNGFIVSSNVANTTMATILILLPIISALMATVVCASMLPTEFNERTVYLSLPLPMSRRSFYIGKFLAGIAISCGTVLAAYGIALILAMNNGGEAYSGPMMESLILALCGTFFFCAMTYMFSASSKRGPVLKTLLLSVAGIPGLAYVIAFALGQLKMTQFSYILGYFPCFAQDLALTYLGTPNLGGLSLASASMYGTIQMSGIGSLLFPGFEIGSNIAIMCAVCILLGLVMLMRGYSVIARRDM